MVTKIIDGKELASKLRQTLKAEVARLEGLKAKPCLAVILVGSDPASLSYVTAKKKACAEVGILSKDFSFPAEVRQEELLSFLKGLNADPEVSGILVQLPLPDPLSEEAIIEAIDPVKDVDGFSPINVGRLVLGQKTFIPPTPYGVLKILEAYGIQTEGKHAVIVGRSNIVGKPLANLLIQKSGLANATVTVCHSHTKDLAFFTQKADILIAAAGKPALIRREMVKEGAVVIDVGVNRLPDSSKPQGYSLVGDVDFQGLVGWASYLTPVPGGVGPLTVTMLLANTLLAFRRQQGLEQG